MDMSSPAQRALQAFKGPLSGFTTPGQAGWVAGKGQEGTKTTSAHLLHLAGT